MKNKLMAFTMMVCLTSVAQAGILLEPYFSLIVSGKSSNTSDLKYSGNSIGARVGWSMLGFSVGLDALLSGTATAKNNSGSNSYNPGGYGIFAAYQFPVLVRGYISYFPSATAKFDSYELSGTSNKIGVQFTGLPFVALGIEAETVNITKSKSGGVTTNSKDTVTFTNFVVSAPFNF